MIVINQIEITPPRIDRSALTVTSLEDSQEDKAYWLAQTPQERLRHLEMLRRINYGHRATARLQRFFEVVER